MREYMFKKLDSDGEPSFNQRDWYVVTGKSVQDAWDDVRTLVKAEALTLVRCKLHK